MEKYKVIDPKGVTIEGVLVEKGDTITLNKGAQLNALLHFKQIKPVEAKAEDPEADADLKAEEEAKAEAKAKK
jgi:hypothetical protein